MEASAGFPSQLVDLHSWLASPVQTNTLTAALRPLTWPYLGNHVLEVWLHWEDTTAKKNAGSVASCLKIFLSRQSVRSCQICMASTMKIVTPSIG